MAIPPAGLTPAGFFLPLTYADPADPPGILADAVDPQTGEYLSISRGMDPVDQQTIIALTLERGSGAAVMDDGNDFHKIRKLDSSAATLIESEARRCLSRLSGQGDIKIRVVYPNASPDNDWAEVGVEFENRRAPSKQRRLAKVMP